VTVGADTSVRRWDPATGSPVSNSARVPGRVHAVAVSPDESLLALAGWHNELRVWDVAAERPVAAMRVDATWLHGVCWLPDGGLCASADTGVYLFHLT
jgi:WD40 repeat protein